MKTVIFDMSGTIYYTDLKSQERFLEVPGAIDTIMAYYKQGYKVVIMSMLSSQYSREILTYLLDKKDLETQTILKDFDILCMQNFGGKDSVEAWKSAMEAYQNVEHIYEDLETKLEKAGLAAQELGHDPQLHLGLE